MIYADSSFLVSLYFKDANSVAAREYMRAAPQEVALSRLAALEVRNAFRLAVFRNWIEPSQESRLQALFEGNPG